MSWFRWNVANFKWYNVTSLPFPPLLDGFFTLAVKIKNSWSSYSWGWKKLPSNIALLRHDTAPQALTYAVNSNVKQISKKFGAMSSWFWEILTFIENNLIVVRMVKVLLYVNILLVHEIKSHILNQFVWLSIKIFTITKFLT